MDEVTLINNALDQFEMASTYEEDNRGEAIDDLQMLAGKNHWDKTVAANRKKDRRPVLTINKLPSLVDQIVNDARQNKIGIKILPNGMGASDELATLFNNIIRGIENESVAEVAYQTAFESAVNSGWGYFRVITEYPEDMTFDQDIKIKRIRNPFSVYMDPNCREHDCRDSTFAFITETVTRDEYKRRWPGKPIADFSDTAHGDLSAKWFGEKTVRVAEYWKRELKKRRIVMLSDGRTIEGDTWDVVKNEILVIDPGIRVLKERESDYWDVNQYVINGSEILEGPTKWAGRWIPIIPVWGKEIVVDDTVYRRGSVRFAKDPQRMYNYFRTTATETVALTPKAPYILAAGQIDGYEDDWANVNNKNLPYLLYNVVTGANPPQRQVVTQTAIGEITESNIANEEMKETTGIFNASQGAQGNEISGKAIIARQSRSEVANYVFMDNLKLAIRFCGEILVDLIPKIYDTERQVLIIKETEENGVTMVNQVVMDEESGETVVVNDLTQGRYKVTVTTGPSFSTQRSEASSSMLDFIRVAPESTNLFIDLVAENMSWPGAKKIANRLRKFLPQWIDDEGPPPPQKPSMDETIKQLKAQGMVIGNEKRKLDVVAKRRELTNEREENVKAGAVGALRSLGIELGGGEGPNGQAG